MAIIKIYVLVHIKNIFMEFTHQKKRNILHISSSGYEFMNHVKAFTKQPRLEKLKTQLEK